MFEDYMQNVLGYRMNPYPDTYEGYYPYNYMNCIGNCNFDNKKNNEIEMDLENCYPEIYKIIYPMIKKVCMQNREQITIDLIEKMTEEVFNNIETGDVINLNINIGNSNETNRSITQKVQNRGENEKENRVQNNNYLLRDLIKILLLRELIGRPVMPRPPMPPVMPRPPFGRPPMPRF